MYEVVMSICDPVLKDQICNHEDHEDIGNKQDMLGLLKISKKTLYSNRDDDTHTGKCQIIIMYNKRDSNHYKNIVTNLLHTGRCARNGNQGW